MIRSKSAALLLVSGLALSAASPAAERLQPASATLLDLGAYQAVVYYEDTPAGGEVTTTLRSASGGDGLRYVSRLTLGETQSIAIDAAEPVQIQFAYTTRGLSVDVVKAQGAKP